jgi:hypothetical protein
MKVEEESVYFKRYNGHCMKQWMKTPKATWTSLIMGKKSTSISWIIIYANCIFSLYVFLSAHSKDDEECGGDYIANG